MAAHSARCATAAELYTNYLAGITRYQAMVTQNSSSSATKNEALRRKGQPLLASRVKRVTDDEKKQVLNVVCYNCQELAITTVGTARRHV